VTRHYTELRGNVFPGDKLTFQGKVVNKYIKDKEGFVEIESRAQNQNGRRVALGKTTANLFRRKK